MQFFLKKFNGLKKRQNKGFTIIETMIAMTIFLIVIMIGSGALINAYSVGNKSKGMRTIMDGLSAAMDEMAREIRMGSHYRCDNFSGSVEPQSGEDCWVLVFEKAGGDVEDPLDQVVYFRFGNPLGTLAKLNYSSLGTPIQLLPDEVRITAGGFSVLGAEPPEINGGGDQQQPFVVIRLVGTITYKRTTTPFSLQTSISQRSNDLTITTP
jgi:prepilin-type N-terminal cleavage/methylation domain-containing protein